MLQHVFGVLELANGLVEFLAAVLVCFRIERPLGIIFEQSI
jgi:hypothetical protein